MNQTQTQHDHPFTKLSNYPIKQVLKKLIPFYKMVSGYIITLIILTLLSTIVSALLPLSSKILIDYIVGNSSVATISKTLSSYGIAIELSWLQYLFKTIRGFITLLSIITIIHLIVSVARQICVFNLRQRFTAKVNHSLFSVITHYNMLFVKKFPSGYLTSRIFQNSNSVEQLISHVIPNIITQLLKFTFGRYILFQLSTKMTLICLAVTPFYVILNFIFYSPLKSSMNK